MLGTQYVKNRLQEAIELFPQVRFRYEEDNDSVVHFIEVSPAYFESDDSFEQWRRKVFFEFISLYPYENLCFFEEDYEFFAYDMVEKWETIIEGNLYKETV